MKNLILTLFFWLVVEATKAQSSIISPNYLKVPFISSFPALTVNDVGAIFYYNSFLTKNHGLYQWNGTNWLQIIMLGFNNDTYSSSPAITLSNYGTGSAARFDSDASVALQVNNNSSTNATANFQNSMGNGTALEIVGQIKIPSAATNRAIFKHATTAGNIIGNYTILSYPNALASDFLMVTQTIGLGGNPNVISVNYAGGAWTIYNVNGAAMPVNTNYNVLVIRQ